MLKIKLKRRLDVLCGKIYFAKTGNGLDGGKQWMGMNTVSHQTLFTKIQTIILNFEMRLHSTLKNDEIKEFSLY